MDGSKLVAAEDEGEPESLLDPGVSCPVCFDSKAPKTVFSCQECDNWVCGRCKEHLYK